MQEKLPSYVDQYVKSALEKAEREFARKEAAWESSRKYEEQEHTGKGEQPNSFQKGEEQDVSSQSRTSKPDSQGRKSSPRPMSPRRAAQAKFDSFKDGLKIPPLHVDVRYYSRLEDSLSNDLTTVSLKQNSGTKHQWLDAVETFSEQLDNIWNRISKQIIASETLKSAKSSKMPILQNTGDSVSDHAGSGKSYDLTISESQYLSHSGRSQDETRNMKEIIVALIDDGVDIMVEQLADRILTGKSFCEHDDRTFPWFTSESGHGTVMASMIATVCPMAKIFPIRLKTGARLTAGTGAMINVESAALAIRAAVDHGASIISISWTLARPSGNLRADFDEAMRYAISKNVLMFCSCRDGDYHDTIDYYPAAFRQDAVIKVGAAKGNQKPCDFAGQIKNLDFLFPGVDVLRGNASSGQRTETGSSVATALGAGLAALILCCVRIAQFHAPDDSISNVKVMADLHNRDAMVKAIKSFGMSSSEATGRKFVEVWRKLDEINDKIGRQSERGKRDLVTKLAKELVSHLLE